MKENQEENLSDQVLCRCIKCDYDSGFHIAFKPDEENKKTGLIFICPSCKTHFETGWSVELNQ